jgi:signal transduction histidine kinase
VTDVAQRRTRSLRTRLALLTGGLAALLVVVAGVLVVHRDWRLTDAVLLDEVMDAADEQDRLVAQQFDDGVVGDVGDEVAIDPATSRDVVAIGDVEGRLDESAGPLDVDAVEQLADAMDVDTLTSFDLFGDEVRLDGGRWAVGATGCIEPEACSWILVAREYQPFGAYLLDRLGWLAGGTLLVALLAGLASWWAAGRSLRAVDGMRREVDEITAADLGRRVEVPPSGDELAALATSFNGMIERLDRSVGAQRRFTSDAAHELRSPLTGVRATLEVAQRQPDRAAPAIDTAIAQIDRAARLVDDLLVLARHDGGAASSPMRLADLDDVVRTEARSVAERHPGLTVDRSGVQPVQAPASAVAIARVVQNLLDNAAAHARSRVRVRLGTSSLPDTSGRPVVHWELRVDDDGPGIAREHRERVFERFARVDDARSRHTGGTGLGLAIVREVVEQHGGTVTVGDSDLGGASFVVRVPLRLAS